MKQATFTTHGSGAVTVEYADPETDIRECRTFIRTGRYVHELIGVDGRQRQVCEGLAAMGVTLMVDDDADLLATIRREYLRMRRDAIARLAA